MHQKSIKWGIIGCGNIAHKFAEDLQLSPAATLSAVASRSLSKAEKFAKTYDCPMAFGDYEQMLAEADLDIVYIATPHNLHYDHTMLCLRYRRHVLCEKPLSINSDRVLQMQRYATQQGCMLMEALWSHFLPALVKARSIITSGEIGEVLHLRADFGFAAPYHPEKRLYNKSLAGGALLDVGIYPCYLLLQVLGRPDRVQASATFAETGVDVHTGILASYTTGQQAYLEASFRSTTPCIAEVYGTAGKVVIHSRWHEADSLTVLRGDNIEEVHLPKTGNGYYHELEAVQQTLLMGGINPPFTAADSREIIHLLDRIRQEIGLEYDF